MGQLARDEGLSPELIISSDAVRARLTAEAMKVAICGRDASSGLDAPRSRPYFPLAASTGRE